MKSLKRRIKKIEDDVKPQEFIKIEIISHIPNFPSQTLLVPKKRKKR